MFGKMVGLWQSAVVEGAEMWDTLVLLLFIVVVVFTIKIVPVSAQ